MGAKHSQRDKSTSSQRTESYNGAKLQRRGVLLEVYGLPDRQFKNVRIEIVCRGNRDLVTTEKFDLSDQESTPNDMFEFSAKFMGIAVDSETITLQDLDANQGKNITTIEMLGKIKFSVSQLRQLLLKDFYDVKLK